MVFHGFSCINIRQVFHSFSCINIRQVPWEVLKTEAEKQCSIAIIALKLETFATFRVISCTILFRLLTDIARTLFARIMPVLGQGSTHLVTPWPRYEHTESCIAVH